MLCARCGRKGFPVRIACLKCNATLPDVPVPFEAPSERSKPKHVECERCGSVALDARIACQYCDGSFPRPFRLSDEDEIYGLDGSIAYYTFACSREACEECRKWDGFCFLPARSQMYSVPIPTCQYPVCWCDIVGVFPDEGTLTVSGPNGQSEHYAFAGSGEDIAAFLKKSGGAARNEQIESYISGQTAPERKTSASETAGVDIFTRAFRSERNSPEAASSLYRESIAAWKSALAEDPSCRWDYLDDSYNRLTLTLERANRFAEAIEAIEDYRAFRALMGRTDEVDAIAKREKKLRKRIVGG